MYKKIRNSSSLSTAERIAVCSPLSASESRTLERQSRGPLLIYYWSGILDRCIPYAFASGACIAPSDFESALGGTKLLPDLLLSVSRFSFRGLPPARAGKGSGTDVNSRPDAQRPPMSGNVSRVVSRIFKRRRKSHKGSEYPPYRFRASSSCRGGCILVCIQWTTELVLYLWRRIIRLYRFLN